MLAHTAFLFCQIQQFVSACNNLFQKGQILNGFLKFERFV